MNNHRITHRVLVKTAAMALLGLSMACPATPETSKTSASESFPAINYEGGIKTEQGFLITLDSLSFESGSAHLPREALQKLKEIAKIIEESGSSKVIIQGYTDSLGTSDQNMFISKARANFVFDVLVDRGLDPKIFDVVGYSDARPVADNDTSEGRQRNRRVEILILLTPASASKTAQASAPNRAALKPLVTKSSADESLVLDSPDLNVLGINFAELNSVKTELGRLITLDSLSFDSGSADLTPAAAPKIDRIAKIIRQSAPPKVLIKGHTDNVGDPGKNLFISKARANFVFDALMDRDIDPGIFEIVGYGDREPIASNDTLEGQQRNRRVEILILSPSHRPDRLQKTGSETSEPKTDAPDKPKADYSPL